MRGWVPHLGKHVNRAKLTAPHCLAACKVSGLESGSPHFSTKQTSDLFWSSLQREMDHEVKTPNDFHCVPVSRCLAVVVFMVAVLFTIYYVVI